MGIVDRVSSVARCWQWIAFAAVLAPAAHAFDRSELDPFGRREAIEERTRVTLPEILRMRSAQYERIRPWTIADPQLFDAARNADRESTRKRAAQPGVNVNVRDALGDSPLLFAVRQGDLETARSLLRAGALPDVKGSDGVTPLGRAALDGELELVRTLLDAGALIDLRGDNGGTPLINAATMNRREVARLLWQRGANPWSFDRDGLPALILAIDRGHTRLVLDLLDLGADPSTLDRAGKPALYWSVLRRNRDATLALLRRGAAPGTVSLGIFDPPIEPDEYARDGAGVRAAVKPSSAETKP